MNGKSIKIILVIVVLIPLMGILFARQFVSNKKPTAQEQALQQAKEFKPKGVCGAAITPAIHKNTGARYAFTSTCLPDRWKPE